jgi:hypothetical protein
MTPDEVDELYSRVHGVQNDLVALLNTQDSMRDLIIENALMNIGKAIELVAKLMPQTEDAWS